MKKDGQSLATPSNFQAGTYRESGFCTFRRTLRILLGRVSTRSTKVADQSNCRIAHVSENESGEKILSLRKASREVNRDFHPGCGPGTWSCQQVSKQLNCHKEQQNSISLLLRLSEKLLAGV